MFFPHHAANSKSFSRLGMGTFYTKPTSGAILPPGLDTTERGPAQLNFVDAGGPASSGTGDILFARCGAFQLRRSAVPGVCKSAPFA
jgi:hypothetical protein